MKPRPPGARTRFWAEWPLVPPVRQSHVNVHILFRLGAVLAFVLLPSIARGQPNALDASEARLHLGPLALHPRLAIKNVGMDTNVFNDSETPVRDFTATVGPELHSWLRAGRLSWSGTSLVAWNYFRESASQRSFDLSQKGRVDLSLGRIVPYAIGSAERTRKRPNLEIDARVRQETTETGGGVTLLVGAKTAFTIEHVQGEFEYGQADMEGISLAEVLDRRETTTTLTGRYTLTPLTTIVIRAESRQDRFEFSPDRDSDSLALIPAVEFKPLALISGEAAVGVRRFAPLSSDLAGYFGVVSDVTLNYQVYDLTRFSVQVQRDVDYSFELIQPYYVSTGAKLAVVQSLGAGWDVGAHAGRTGLDYRARDGGSDVEANRLDRVSVYGLTVGRRFGSEIRVGLDLEYVARTSSVGNRAYEGLRGGGAFTYGF